MEFLICSKGSALLMKLNVRAVWSSIKIHLFLFYFLLCAKALRGPLEIQGVKLTQPVPVSLYFALFTYTHISNLIHTVSNCTYVYLYTNDVDKKVNNILLLKTAAFKLSCIYITIGVYLNKPNLKAKKNSIYVCVHELCMVPYQSRCYLSLNVDPFYTKK